MEDTKGKQKSQQPGSKSEDIAKANDEEAKEEEEIFEDVGGIQFEVFPKFDGNVHISTKQKFPEKLNRYNCDKKLLGLTPNKCELKNGETVFLVTQFLNQCIVILMHSIYHY